MTPKGESRPEVDKGKSPEGFRVEAWAGGQVNVMEDAWGRGPEGLAWLDHGGMANKSQGDHGSINHSGGKYGFVRAEGEASDVVARCEGPKGLGKASEEPQGPGGCARSEQEAQGGRSRSGDLRKGTRDEIRLWKAWGCEQRLRVEP